MSRQARDCCEQQREMGDVYPYSHDGECENYDGAPATRAQVTAWPGAEV